MAVSWVLLALAIPSLAMYLVRSWRLISRLTDEEKSRFTKCSRPIQNVIAVAVMGALLQSDLALVRLAAPVLAIPAFWLLTRAHRQRLRSSGFDEPFVKQLNQLAFFSVPAAVLTMLALALS